MIMRVWDLYANTKSAAEVRKSAAPIHGAIENVIDQDPDFAVTVGDSLLDGATQFDLIELQSVNREACYASHIPMNCVIVSQGMLAREFVFNLLVVLESQRDLSWAALESSSSPRPIEEPPVLVNCDSQRLYKPVLSW